MIRSDHLLKAEFRRLYEQQLTEYRISTRINARGLYYQLDTKASVYSRKAFKYCRISRKAV